MILLHRTALPAPLSRPPLMILRYERLSTYRDLFKTMTGLTVPAFDALVVELRPRLLEAEQARLSRPRRQRAIGAGHPFELSWRDQILLTVFWLRHYPNQEVLGYLFGVSDTTAARAITRVLPHLEAAGRDTMRMPDPGQGHRKDLDQLLQDTPPLAVLVDSFEQRVQRPRPPADADALYSGKKKQHTLKVQVAVDEISGRIVDVADSVPGPTADIKLLDSSGLLARLPEGVGALGDLAYVGIGALHPQGLGAAPRRKPRGQSRPPEDITYNRAFSRRRVRVEHGIGRLRRYQAVTQTDRHHRRRHSQRVRAVAGLVNRQIDHRGTR
jgi:DDE superfamily endonuclease/Helix-turn-helix of DDE superfamily endonuclease